MKAPLILLAVVAVLPLWANDAATVGSPDGRLVVTLDVQDGQPFYCVAYDGLIAVGPSLLGLKTNEQDLTRDFSIKAVETSRIDEQYSLDRSKLSQVHYVANRLLATLATSRDQQLQVEFRVSDNDVAFRYLLPKQGETGAVRVTSEATSFSFPDGTTTFLTPQSDAMIGWKRTKPSYEELYVWDAPMSQPSQYGHGYTFPCLFHEKIGEGTKGSKGSKGIADELWVMVSETGVDSHYCASHLSDAQANTLKVDGAVNTYTIAYPMPEEQNGIGTADAAIVLPGVTPWRTLTVGRTLHPIVETTAPWDNVRPVYETSHQYKYGRGTWSWILWQDDSINFDDICRYVDLAQAMGYEYVLIDNWWDTNIGKVADGTAKNPTKSIEKLIEYAHSKNVDVFLWYSSSGYWNDIVQGPVNRMDNSVVRKREMQWLQSVGVKGIKVDFFGGDKQETMRLYEEILSDADDHGLMVIFHGCTLPRGWERMYPNYVGSEAVLASENIVFDQRHCDLEAAHATLHPVLRNTVGCMEFGGSFQNKYMNRDNKPRENRHVNTRPCTSTFSLATAILYQNPIQNFALAPNNLEDAPAVSMDFMREVPTTWDEVRFIDGYPGKYLVMARRHGDTWYVAAINAEPQKLVISLDLSVLSASSFTLYSGGDNPTAKPLKLKHGKTLLTLAPNDGAVIVAR
jgi:hypothetical protein